jgi:hypothetical protein
MGQAWQASALTPTGLQALVHEPCEFRFVFDGPGFSESDRSCAVSVEVDVDPPLLGQHPRHEQAVEGLAVHVPIADASIERLDPGNSAMVSPGR